jgi:hypothetical protein
MLDTYIKNRGMTKTIVHNNNRNTINETNWDADYDGDVANVSLDLTKNGRNKHLDFKFTNDDLANMLSIPSVNQPIHKRLKMDFRKPESSFEKIFLELEPESSSDSDSDSDSDSSSDFDLENMNMNTIFDNNPVSSSSPIQELLTHISSPKSNEEFIMPFQDYSLNSFKPVIKVVHRPRSKSSKRSKSSRRSKKSSKKSKSSHSVRHHNYPAKRKSVRRSTSRRR